MRASLILSALAACGGPSSSRKTTPTNGNPSDAAHAPTGPDELCLAGDCANGKGVHTHGRGADRAIVDGTFTSGTRTGDAKVYRVAGQTFETLEIDAASGTATLRHPDFDIVGQVTTDPEPQLSDPSAAVMLPTGEWFFAEWSPTAVAAKDSNLTGARSVAQLPEDYADLFAGVAILEEARHAARELQIRPPGGDDTPFATRIAIAPLTAYVPDPKEPVAYIVGVGVVDPASPAIAALRAGRTPAGPIAIIRADGSTGKLEIAGGIVTQWPTWNEPVAGWAATVDAKLQIVAMKQAGLRAKLGDARATTATTDLATSIGAIGDDVASALAAVDEALEVAPGTDAPRVAKLRALRDQIAMAHARVTLASKVVELASTPDAGLRGVLDDVLGQIALDWSI